MDVIKTEKLTKYYGKARGIMGLDLTVSEGEFFGFIGPNGAGKSTTIRTLLGLIAPSSGSATVFGKDVTKEKVSVLRDIGYLPSEALFYGGMKVKDVLKLSADLRKKDCKAEAKMLCERLQLDVSRKVDDLSFGNRKKVAIVCTLQHRPKLLILDVNCSILFAVYSVYGVREMERNRTASSSIRTTARRKSKPRKPERNLKCS